MNFAYKCKFCGKPGIVTGDGEGLALIKPEIWLPKICCDRCGDYMVQKRKLTEAFTRICRSLESCRATVGIEKRATMETVCKSRIVDLTKRFAALACNYYRLTNVWDQEFSDMMFENPGKFPTILSTYLSGLAREARRAA